MGGIDYGEIELIVLGRAMRKSEDAQKLAMLPDDTFISEGCRKIHAAIKKLILDHKEVDMLAVMNIVGTDYTTTITTAASTSLIARSFDQASAILMDYRMRRIIRETCVDIAGRADDLSISPDSLINDFQKATNDTGVTTNAVTMKDAVMRVIDNVDHAKERRIYTGIAGIDGITGGLKGGKLVVIGARPGVGKTALALFMASNVADKVGRVLFASLEMNPEEIAERLVAAYSGVDVSGIESGNLTEDDYRKLGNGYALAGNLRIEVDTKLKSPMLLRQAASTMAGSKEGLAMIVLDYIQLMTADTRSKSRYEDISNISRELKLIAMDLNVPVIALTQFNRMSESPDGKKRRPSMAESKDSGSIEQDANIFITQYAPDEPTNDGFIQDCYRGCKSRGHELQILVVEKNRQGKTGIVAVEFDKAHMTFKTLINDTGKRW